MNIFECEIEKNFQLYVIFKPFCGKKKKIEIRLKKTFGSLMIRRKKKIEYHSRCSEKCTLKKENLGIVRWLLYCGIN